jgi:23S rRNA (uracil1939-C5)-methyltransferase
MRKGRKFQAFDVENIEIIDFAAEGKCIAKLDGEVVFVEGAVAPQDIANIKIYNSKKGFKHAHLLEVVQPSPLRADAFCSHFGICGGCKWQHLAYQHQLSFKAKQVSDALERIGKVAFPTPLPILGSAQTTYYRNKLEYTFSNSSWLTKEQMETGEAISRDALGFHIPKRFDKILNIDHCYLQPEPSNKIRLALHKFATEQGYEYYNHVKQEGFLRNVVIRTANTGNVMVILIVARPEMEKIEALLQMLKDTFGNEISSLNYVINQKMNDTYHDQEVVCVQGNPYIEEQMEELTFRVGPQSFYQTNASQAYELYKVARNFAQLTGKELVYDLYTGTGTIANFVAKQAAHVIGIEYVASAIEDAKVNSDINNIRNTSFFAGDMRKFLTPDFIASYGKPDVVITDPPRAGMDKEVVETLMLASPKRIVYVSCNPATQARDLALMDELYEVKAVQPVDMFPHTHHVENVVLLEKR